jgi:regulator of RNase E activity RraB
MADDFPDDADGDALRRVESDGSDMSKPMFIDFHISVVGEANAISLGVAVRKLGYRTHLYDSDGKRSWTCQCSTRMLATYESVIAIQNELAELSAPFGGYCDGWGTFGNGPNGQPDYSQDRDADSK